MAAIPYSTLPDTDIVPEARLHTNVRASGVAAVTLVVLFAVAIATVPIGSAVMASGQIGVESNVKRIAHPTGGTVKRVFVANGEHVEAGAPLIQLDDAVASAQDDLASLSVDQMTAQRARLDAERLGAAGIVFPAALLDGHPGAAAAMADERRLFALRRSEANGLRAQLSARIAQLGEQIAGYRHQIDAARRQQALLAPERDGVRALYDKGLVTLSRLNQLERGAVDLDGNVAALEAQIAQARGRITETREQLIQLDQTRRAEAGTQLGTLNAALNDGEMRAAAARDQRARTLIAAPYAGIVDKMTVTAIGDVVRASEPVMEIVPDRDRKLVDIAVSPTDVDQIRRGQRTRIRFGGLNDTATPEVRGIVTLVAPDRTTNPQTGQSFFAARVAIDPRDLARYRGLMVRTGMPAEVFVETGSRSMLSYLTKPLREQFARAFRDN